METHKILICRLCFEIDNSGFGIIGESTKETLNFLLLNLALEISDEPLICDSCVISLKECFDFKTDLLRKSDSIVIKQEGVDLIVPKIDLNESVEDTPDMVCDSCVGGLKDCLHFKTGCLQKRGSIIIKHEGVGLNVPKIHLTGGEIDIPETFNNSNVCCSCKELINGESCAHWTNEEKDVATMLEIYFPELNLNDTTASMCAACYKSLQNQLAFISKCLTVEDKIKEYCKAEGTNSKGQVELGSVLDFVSKNQLQNKMNSSINDFELERACEETEKGDETKAGNENLVVVEEPLICGTEKEDVDIKAEQDDGDRFDAQKEYLPSQSNMTEAAQFKCKVCTSKFKQNSTFLRHIKIHKHPSELTRMLVHKGPSEVTMHKCQVCNYKHRHKHKVSAHMRTRHKDPSDLTKYKCKVCTFQTRLKYSLAKHMLVHKDSSEVVMYKCEICPYQAKRKYNLHQHVLRRHGPSDVTMYQCDVCTYQCKVKYSLTEHMLVHKDSSDVVMYKCEMCTYQSKTKSNLTKHISRRHEEPSELTVYKCGRCTYQTSLKCRLAEHVPTHKDPSEVVMYKCEVCTFQTKKKHNLVTHIFNQHRRSEATMFDCKICTFQCRYKCTFTRHMIVTHQDPAKMLTHKCEICTYQTTKKQNLSRHMLTHKDPSEIVMHRCEICPYQSKHKYQLSRHMLTHKSEKKSAAINGVSQKHGKSNVV